MSIAHKVLDTLEALDTRTEQDREDRLRLLSEEAYVAICCVAYLSGKWPREVGRTLGSAMDRTWEGVSSAIADSLAARAGGG